MRNHFLRSRIRASGPWTPAQITTALWFDAADPTTVTLNGSNVSQWNDKSGNSRHVVQPTDANRPSYSFQINARNVIRFSGSSFLSSSDNVSIALQSRSVFIVCRENSHIANAGFLTIAPATGNDYDSVNGVTYEGSAGNNWFEVAGSTGTSYFPAIAAASPTSGLGIYGEILSGTSGTLYLNGIDKITDSSFTPFAAASTGKIFLGTRFIANTEYQSQRLNGDICEIIYCESALSTLNRQLVEGYLAHKWGLTSDLPADHPYKTSPP